MMEKEDDNFEPEEEFNWQDYLESTNSQEVPHTIFTHVEQSLQNGFEEGMKLEVPVKDKPNCNWFASVVLSCGPLLRLRYEGETDRKNDFWFDITKVKAWPLGWSDANKYTLQPPDSLTDHINVEAVKESLVDAVTVPPELLLGEGYTPVDRIKTGMRIEVQDLVDPYRMWVAMIVENVGGRLLLRYDTPEGVCIKDFWLFYSSPRIYPMGWAKERGPPWVVRKPSNISSVHTIEEWHAVLEKSKAEATKLPFPKDILMKTRKSLRPHDVSLGNKLEAIHPVTLTEVCPATVVKIFDSYYFLVAIDIVGVTENHQLTWLATSSHPYIFPVGWAAQHGLKVRHPRGWTLEQDEFDWPSYLSATESSAAALPLRPALPPNTSPPIGANMKLEAVDIDCHNNVCVASISHVTDHLLWITLDSDVNRSIQLNIKECFWPCFKAKRAISWDSLDIFPVGWCDSNSYPLKAPKITPSQPTLNKSPAKKEIAKPKDLVLPSEKSSSWCPKIYFNHKCFSGPFLSKGRLAGLPRYVGPGPVVLVLKEVLSMLISVAYISSRVLKELQCSGLPRPNMHLEMLKAKYKTNVYRAMVEIITSSDKVDDFCREVCRKLQVCPHLFSLTAVGEKPCPENCHTLSKTRFLSVSTASSQSTLVGQRKVGRPCGESRKTQLLWPRRPPSTRREYLTASKRLAESVEGATVNKKMRYATRGIKLPNFGLKNSQIKNAFSTESVTGLQNMDSSSANKEETASDPKAQTPNNGVEPPTLNFKRRGRRTKAENERIRKMEELTQEGKMDDSQYHVETNPVLWTVEDVYQYMKRTQDCGMLANMLRDEEFDGKALMLLNLPSCLEELNLTRTTAVRLCRHVEAVKFTFFSKFVTDTNPS